MTTTGLVVWGKCGQNLPDRTEFDAEVASIVAVGGTLVRVSDAATDRRWHLFNEFSPGEDEELQLARIALDIGALRVGGPLSTKEAELVDRSGTLPESPAALLEAIRDAIHEGKDPLGTRLLGARDAVERRSLGSFFTPEPIADAMVASVLGAQPTTIVDPGCGSGRFLVRAALKERRIKLVGVDIDPVATLVTRAALSLLDVDDVRIHNGDFRQIELTASGKTAFVSNPPYVRHHEIDEEGKRWADEAARRLGLRISGLAGLHVHFFLATALLSQPGDIGCFITSAEWLDVNYGEFLRQLLTKQLRLTSLHLLDPLARPFHDAMTTAVITCFQAGSQNDKVRLQFAASPSDLHDLPSKGWPQSIASLASANRWTQQLTPRSPWERDTTRLGQLFRVHRGDVTGANGFFILSRTEAQERGVERWCRPAITSAEEILSGEGVVRDTAERRLLLDVPRELDRSLHPSLDAYLRLGEPTGISGKYVTSHRRPWWSLNPKKPAPIVASYMARRAPVFALNPDGLALVNIAHGLYPVVELDEVELARFVELLNGQAFNFRGHGRTYHGGLEKFEPGEMENLRLSGV
ncbi:MAG: N-6 DNA methylase [Dehalococcoidia bacterium]